MRVWIVTVGEPLPTDPSGDRLLRHGLLAEHLVARGHDVTWWTSSFDHFHKRHRVQHDEEQTIGPRYRIRVLKSVGYPKNVSPQRFVDHWRLAHSFRRAVASEDPPDVVLCSYPPIELAREATRYGQQRGVPVALDIRDWWPDVFVEFVPRWARGFARRALTPYTSRARDACRDATVITGITPEILEFGLRHASREATSADRAFPLAYAADPPPEADLNAADRKWRERGVDPTAGPIVCFFGTFSRHKLDLETVIRAAYVLNERKSRIQIVLCGAGDDEAYYRDLASRSSNIFFPGWAGRAEIWSLMHMASAGLAPYQSSSSYVASIPNKPIEYMSAGLPVVSSLAGKLEHLLSEARCGRTYTNGEHEALASILLELEHDAQLRNELSVNAARLFEARFAAARVFGDMCRWLEDLSRRGTSHAARPPLQRAASE